MNVLEGKLVAEGMKIGIVCARFNEFITSKLLGGAMDALVRHGVQTAMLMLHGYREHLKSSGCSENGCNQASTMQSSAWVLSSKVLHLIMNYVCAEVSKGIATVSLSSGLPVLFGVLTTDNIEQAIERAGTKAGNKGYDVAVSAIEMVNLFKNL